MNTGRLDVHTGLDKDRLYEILTEAFAKESATEVLVSLSGVLMYKTGDNMRINEYEHFHQTGVEEIETDQAAHKVCDIVAEAKAAAKRIRAEVEELRERARDRGYDLVEHCSND